MNFDEYQKRAATTDLMATDATQIKASAPSYVAKVLGLVGEAGEVAEKYKKIIRDKNGVVSAADKTELVKELGDVLWYTAMLAKYLGVDFEEVANANLDKLASRKSRGAQRGSGDNR